MLPRVSAPRKGPVVLGVGLVVLLGAVLGLWAARGWIATSMARGELEARGLTCDDRLSVALDATFSSATIGPTRCVHEGGLLEAIELLGDVEVELDGTEPASVVATSARVTLRSQDVRGGSGWASELRQLSLEQRVAGLIKGISEIGAMGLPPIECARLEVVRQNEVIARGQRIAVTPAGEGAQVRAQEIVFPARLGRLALTGVSGTADATRVTLAGRAAAEVGLGILSVSRGGPFELEASGLDSGSPRFSLSGNFR